MFNTIHYSRNTLFNSRLGHLAAGSARSQGPMNLGGGKPRSLELEDLDRIKAEPLKAKSGDAVKAAKGVRNAVDSGAGEDHEVKARSVKAVMASGLFMHFYSLLGRKLEFLG